MSTSVLNFQDLITTTASSDDVVKTDLGGAGLYIGASNSLYLSLLDEGESVGNPFSESAIKLNASAKLVAAVRSGFVAMGKAGISPSYRGLGSSTFQIVIPSLRLELGKVKGSINVLEINTETGSTKSTVVSAAKLFPVYATLFGDGFGVDIPFDTVKTDIGAGLIVGASGALYYAPDSSVSFDAGTELSDGIVQLMSLDAKVVKAVSDAATALERRNLSLPDQPVAAARRSLDLESENPDEVEVALPLFKLVPGKTPTFTGVNIYRVDSTTGAFRLTPLTKIGDVLDAEVRFETDFNGDGISGNGIQARFADGVYLTATGDLYWSPDSTLQVGDPIDELEALRLSGDPNLIKTLRNAVLALASLPQPEEPELEPAVSAGSRPVSDDNDTIVAVELALPIYTRPPNKAPVFSSLTIYRFNVISSSKPTTRSIASSKLADILAQETIFGADFNGDRTIGDTVITNLGAGLYLTATGLNWNLNPDAQSGEPLDPGSILLLARSSSTTRTLAAMGDSVEIGQELGVAAASRDLIDENSGDLKETKIVFPNFSRDSEDVPVFVSLTVYTIKPQPGLPTTKSITKADEVIDLEFEYDLDFNGDGGVGDVVRFNIGNGVYLTSLGLKWIPDDSVEEGAVLPEDAILLAADKATRDAIEGSLEALYQTQVSPVARDLDPEIDSATGVAVAFPIFELDEEGFPAFVLLHEFVYNDNSKQVVKKTFTKLSDVLGKEVDYGYDFNDDIAIGDVVDDDFGGTGLYATTSDLLYWSPAGEFEGEAISQDASLLQSSSVNVSDLSDSYDILTGLVGGEVFGEQVDLNNDGLDDSRVFFPIFVESSTEDQAVFRSLKVFTFNGTATGAFGGFKVTDITSRTTIWGLEDTTGFDLDQDGFFGNPSLQ